jgi:ubiquinone/menaquinone biosynthesis C-methylase UbiE
MKLGSRNFALFLLFAVVSLPPAGLRAQTAPAPAQQSERKISNPYRGDLSVFEYPERDQKLQIDRVMDLLRIKPGSSVADIGAGSGWFTVRAARRVGSAGLVYAVDINPKAIDYIDDRARREKLENVHTVLGKEDDPMLPAGSMDSVLILKTYHEIAHPVALLENLRKSLKPDALVGIIDRNGRGDDHGIDREVVIREADRAGYKLAGSYDFVKSDREDYFLIFQSR